MFAAHLAAALAVKAAAPRAPTSALLIGAFLPDVCWILLAGAGVEPAAPSAFFDGWSHSILSIFIEATLFASLFWRRGREVWIPIWIATMSHAILDLPIHPRPLQLYPRAPFQLFPDLWSWGSERAAVGFTHYWWIETTVLLILLGVYIARSAQRDLPRRPLVASALLVVGLHFLF